MNKLSYRPAASPERLLVAAISDRVSPSLAGWIGDRIINGADIEHIRRLLTSALGQINRVERYVTDRDVSGTEINEVLS